MKRDFEFTAGTPALDFVDTLAGRETQPTDLLAVPEDLDRWATLAGIASEPATAAEQEDLRRARRLRECIYRAAKALVAGDAPAARDISTLNSYARKPTASPQWRGGKISMVSSDFFEALFSLLAADAILRLSEDTQHKLRQCPDCKMLFFDNSRPGKRVWCSSSSGCGNRAKVRRHRARQSRGKTGDQV